MLVQCIIFRYQYIKRKKKEPFGIALLCVCLLIPLCVFILHQTVTSHCWIQAKAFVRQTTYKARPIYSTECAMNSRFLVCLYHAGQTVQGLFRVVVLFIFINSYKYQAHLNQILSYVGRRCYEKTKTFAISMHVIMLSTSVTSFIQILNNFL